MVNKFLLVITLIPVFIFVGVNALKCPMGNGAQPNSICNGSYCYYVHYEKFENGNITINETHQGCAEDFINVWLPDPNKKTGAQWAFPIDHCQHFQTNQTGTTYEYIYGNFCDTRDNCTYSDSGDLVCAGLRSSPALVAMILMIAGIFGAKIFV